MLTINIKEINIQIFRQDKRRRQLLKAKNLKDFVRTYSSRSKIPNLNTGSYWNHILKNDQDLMSQSPMTQDKIRWIAEQIENSKLSILDLGIGDGFVEELLSKRVVKYKYSGIDISKISIEKAKKIYNGEFILSDVLKVKDKFNNKKFDVILAIELLEHISVSKLFSLYKQIYSLLKIDGKFVLSIPINENLHLKNCNPSAHVRDYTFDIIKTELELNGFEIEKHNYLFAFDKYYSLKKFLSRILVNRWKPNSLTIVAKKVSKKM